MKKVILSAVVASFVVMGCGSSNTPKEEIIVDQTITPDGSNAKTSLDWAGTYEGVLPCADCEGINTLFTFNEDGSYEITSEYLGKGLIVEDAGNVNWAENGNQITFTLSSGDVVQYFVSENQLIVLDQDGNKITGELADHYVLNKM